MWFPRPAALWWKAHTRQAQYGPSYGLHQRISWLETLSKAVKLVVLLLLRRRRGMKSCCPCPHHLHVVSSSSLHCYCITSVQICFFFMIDNNNCCVYMYTLCIIPQMNKERKSSQQIHFHVIASLRLLHT